MTTLQSECDELRAKARWADLVRAEMTRTFTDFWIPEFKNTAGNAFDALNSKESAGE